MADKRELARNEALTIWLAGAKWCGAEGEMLREAELAFDKWWKSLSRRDLRTRSGRG